jgi:hypothetical protein
MGIGVIDPATMTWYLRNEPDAGPPDAGVFQYGGAGWKPVVGDWTGSGKTTIGVVDPQGVWYVRDSDTAGPPDVAPFPYGLGGWTPLAGTWAPPAQPLRAAGGQGPGDPGGDPLTQQELPGAVAAALGRLRAAGVAPALLGALASATYLVGPLGAGQLGLTDVGSETVEVSPGAADWGWYVAPAPLTDSAFSPATPGGPLAAVPGGPAAGRMDLLTVVLHEMGHLAGRPDVSTAGHGDDLMADALAPGVRRTEALDQVFAAGGFGLG